MSNLNDLINLAKADGGKFFVIDEEGNAKLVIMSIEDYQRLLLGKLQRQVEDVEKINQEIIKSQIMEPNVASEPPKPPVGPERSRGASRVIPRVDMREEVIDPSFDFEGPKGEVDDLWNTIYESSWQKPDKSLK